MDAGIPVVLLTPGCIVQSPKPITGVLVKILVFELREYVRTYRDICLTCDTL